MKQRCLEIFSKRCMRSFLRSFADGIAQMASFWCLSLLLCFLSWNAIADEQDPIPQLKQQCDQLERNSKWSEAIAVAEKILALTKEKHGEEHAETVDAMHTLARLVNCNGDHSRDERLWQRTLAIEEKLFGKDSPEEARSLRTLANLTSFRGEYEKAEELLHRALRNLEPAPAYNLELGKVLQSLGSLYFIHFGDLEKAESFLLRASGILERCHGVTGEEYLARTLLGLGYLRMRLGDLTSAEPLFIRAIQLREKNLGSRHADTATAKADLAWLYGLRRDLARAEPLFRECLAIEEEVYDSSERNKSFSTLKKFGEMYLNGQELAKAEQLLTRALSVSEGNAYLARERVPLVLDLLGLLYEGRGDYEKAVGFHERAYRAFEENLGPVACLLHFQLAPSRARSPCPRTN